MKRSITVILPVYNAEKTLRWTIDSILTQQGNFELICINDCSTDSSLEILKNYSSYLNLKIINLEKNCGVSHARNIGLAEAKGELVMFIDADDTFPPNLLSYVENLPLIYDLIIFNYRNVFELCSPKSEQLTNKGRKISSRDCQSALIGLKHNSSLNTRLTSVWGKVFNKQIIIDNDITFNEEISIGEDSIFLYEFYEYSEEIWYYDTVGYNYYINPLSATHTFQPKMIDNDKNWQRALKNLLERLPEHGLSDKYVDYSIAKGILNICYLHLAYKYSNYHFFEILNCIKSLLQQEPYKFYEFSNLDLFQSKDRLILFLLREKLYVIVALVFYLNR